MQRLEQHVRCKVRGKRKRQAELCRQLGAIKARTEQPHRNFLAITRNRANVRIRVIGIKPVHQFGNIAREIIHIAAHMATQCPHRRLIAAWRASKPQIDTTRIERIECSELFGNHQRSMVWQHDTAGSQMQRGGIGRQITNQNRRRRTGDTHHIMVLSQPEAVISALFSKPGEIKGMGEGIFGRSALWDRCQVQHREGNRFVSHNGSLCYSIVIRLKVFFQPGASRMRRPEKLHL